MKKKIFVLMCMILFFVAGCGAKTELDKFKHYLVKKEKFKCKQHECTKKVKFNVPGDISMVLEFDFENNTMMDAVYGNNGLTTTEIIYNWSLKTGAYYSYTLGIKIDATYDYLNDEYIEFR